MGTITILLPKSYFTAFERAAKDSLRKVTRGTDAPNNCCEVTVDGITDMGDLVMIGVEMRAFYMNTNSTYEEKVGKILNNALKQLQP